MSVTWWEGVRITVQAGFSAATGTTYGVWDTGLWDTATWGPDAVWTDISAYVRSINTRRRFARDVAAWETGEATIVLSNKDGRFSPENLSGPYVIGGVTSIRPWRPIRIRLEYGTSGDWIYTGYALSWDEQYARANADATMTVKCVDELAKLAQFDGYEQASQGSGETPGRRVHRILDNAGFTGQRNVASGVTTVQATTLANNAVTELKLTADSEGGALWVEVDGSVWFDHQHALLENPRSINRQVSFDDNAAAPFPYTDTSLEYSGDTVVNIAKFARAGGVEQTAASSASRSLYDADLQYTRSDLVTESDAQVAGLANFYVDQFKDPELRFTSLSFTPRSRPVSLIPQAIDRRVRDLIRVTRRPPGGHTITRDCFISGIAHSITEGGNWRVTFDLQSASPYTSYATSRWDVGKWDSSTWFF